jgi:hypothetical protein
MPVFAVWHVVFWGGERGVLSTGVLEAIAFHAEKVQVLQVESPFVTLVETRPSCTTSERREKEQEQARAVVDLT